MNGAQALVKILEGYGVKHIFGLCGDTSLPFYDALYSLDHNIEHILSRDERSAAYMADAYARITNKVGVCEGPSGGGATYIVPGLVEANESSIPILAITSDVPLTSKGHYPLTELDQAGLFKPLTKFNKVLDNPKNLPATIRAAFREMTTARPGSAHLSFPYDMQVAEIDDNDVWAVTEHGTYPAWPVAPDSKAIDQAVAVLSKASNPVIVCGGAVTITHAEKELDEFVTKYDIAICSSISGRGVLGDDHPNYVGVVGSNGGIIETRKVIDDADVVFFIGCRAGSVTTEKWRYPTAKTKIIHLDCDPAVIGTNYQVTAPIVADAKLGLIALNAAFNSSQKFNGTQIAKAARKAKQSKFDELANSAQVPITPERLVASINKLKNDDAILVADAGTPCPYLSAYAYLPKPGRHLITNRAHGALGYALSAALGAKVGAKDKQVISMMGDGSFGFACGELETAIRCKLPVTFIVVSNSSYGWIKAGQHSGFDKRYYSVDFGTTDHAKVANAFGIKSWKVEDPSKLDDAIKQALSVDEPSLVDVVCQPLELANAPVSEWIA